MLLIVVISLDDFSWKSHAHSVNFQIIINDDPEPFQENDEQNDLDLVA
jgi:hypothetical protein